MEGILGIGRNLLNNHCQPSTMKSVKTMEVKVSLQKIRVVWTMVRVVAELICKKSFQAS